MLVKKKKAEISYETLADDVAEIKKLAKDNKLLEQKVRMLEQKIRKCEVQNKQLINNLHDLRITVEYLNSIIRKR